MRRLRSHLSYANVTASLALFIAVSGAGAYAAGLAPKSVGAPELRPGAVTAAKLRKNAVTTPKVKAKAITSPKIASASVDGRILAAGSVATDKLTYQAITHDKVGPDAITGDQIVESSLTQVLRAAFADAATSAESAQPVAFADVDENGTLNTNLSKGIGPGDVSKRAVGVYCITVPGFNPRGAQATARNIDTDGVIANVEIGGSCGLPAVEVQTYKAGAPTSARFYVVLYR